MLLVRISADVDAVDLVTGVGLVLGAFFFCAGTIALLRFPDVYTRLHALTKGDNVGLGLVLLALTFQASSWAEVFQLLLIWLLVIVASSTTSFLIAQLARRKGMKPWTR